MKNNSIFTLFIAISVLLTSFAFSAEDVLIINGEKQSKSLTDGYQKYPVFNRQRACKGNEAHRKMRITTKRLRSAQFLITAHNGDYQFSDVKLAVNNQYFYPIRGLRAGKTRRVNFPISVSLLNNQLNKDILVVCYLDNFNSSSWVSVDLQIDVDEYGGNTYPGNNGNPTYPGNNGGYNPTYPGNSGGYNPPYPGGNNPPYPGNNGGYNNGGYNNGGYNNGGHHGGGHYGHYTAAEYIRMAERESSYTASDRILIEGSKKINSMTGILQLCKAAYYASNVKTIASVFEDRNRTFFDMPQMSLVKETWNSISQYSPADYMLKALSSRMVSIRKIMRMSGIAYYKESSRQILARLDTLQLHEAVEIPAFEGIKRTWNAISSYSTADNMLIKVAKFIREGRILDQMMELAYYSETRRVLRRMRDNYYGMGNSGHHGGHYGGHYGYRGKSEKKTLDIDAVVEKTVAKMKTPEVDKELYAEFVKATEDDQSGFEFGLKDIDSLEDSKIEAFIETLKDENLKLSTRLKTLKAKLIEKLQFEASQNSNDKAKQWLEAIIIE